MGAIRAEVKQYLPSGGAARPASVKANSCNI
jgi:hypothetical protein